MGGKVETPVLVLINTRALQVLERVVNTTLPASSVDTSSRRALAFRTG